MSPCRNRLPKPGGVAMSAKENKTVVKRSLLYGCATVGNINGLTSVKDMAVMFIEQLGGLTKIVFSIKHHYFFAILFCIVCKKVNFRYQYYLF